jgi:hypothetical protein
LPDEQTREKGRLISSNAAGNTNEYVLSLQHCFYTFS